MNKVTKIILLIAVVLCLIGGILFGIGIAAGGKTQLSKSDFSNLNKYELEKTKLDDFSSLDVDLSEMDLYIQTSDDDHCYLSYQLQDAGKKDPISYEITDKTLMLKRENSGNHYIQFDFTSFGQLLTNGIDCIYGKATLYIPSDKTLEQVSISLDSGDFHTKNQAFNDTKIKLSYGYYSRRHYL